MSQIKSRNRQTKNMQLQVHVAEHHARIFNETYPVGVKVRYWPGVREGDGLLSRTRSAAEAIPSGSAIVWIEGHAGGVALTHVQAVEDGDDE